MTGGGPVYDRFATNGSHEWMMRIGAADAPPILILPPLFEEMNRTRAFIAALMRGLAVRGFGCWLPDLPGTGESERILADCSWKDWQEAVRDAFVGVTAASGGPPLVAAIRGGCLLDEVVPASCRWWFAPVEGTSLARDLARSSLVKDESRAADVLDFAGYTMSASLFAALEAARPTALAPLRTARLDSDRGEADLKLPGPALWRRSEPGNAPELAEALAADLATWSRECVAS